jgi:hypothetical protein
VAAFSSLRWWRGRSFIGNLRAPFSAKADAAVELGVPVPGVLLDGWRGSTGGCRSAPSRVGERSEADCLFVSTRCASAVDKLSETADVPPSSVAAATVSGSLLRCAP